MIRSTVFYQFFKLMKVCLSDKDKFVAFGKKLNDKVDWGRLYYVISKFESSALISGDNDVAMFVPIVQAYLLKVFTKYGTVKIAKRMAKVKPCPELKSYGLRLSLMLLSVGDKSKRVYISVWDSKPFNGLGVFIPSVKGIEPFSDGSFCKVWSVKDIKDFCVKLELLQQVLEERFKK